MPVQSVYVLLTAEAGRTLQIFNLEMKAKMKAHNMTEGEHDDNHLNFLSFSRLDIIHLDERSWP